jgi:hypothetical protein
MTVEQAMKQAELVRIKNGRVTRERNRLRRTIEARREAGKYAGTPRTEPYRRNYQPA